MTPSRALLLPLILPIVLLAACSTQADEPDADSDESAIAASTEVSASYVGRYAMTPATTSDISALLLRADKSYVLDGPSGREQGSYGVFIVSRGAELRLTPSAGPRRRYKVALEEGLRARLTITRSGLTSRLEREPVKCDGVNCSSGRTCVLGERDGVPAPSCEVAPKTWTAALSSSDLWGVQFDNVLQAVGYDGIRRPVRCHVDPAASTIRCAVGRDFRLALTAPIASDGAFSVGTAGAMQHLEGRIDDHGKVTLTRFRRVECTWASITEQICDSEEGDAERLPADVQAFELCRTRTATYDWGTCGYGGFKACSACQGDCGGC